MARPRRAANPPPQVTMTTAQLEEIITRRVEEALAEAEAQRTPRNSETRETHPIPRCSYKDFLNCKPLTFTGTEGPVGLIRWCEKAESVFHMSNCAEQDRVKFATGMLQDSALTWWNTYANNVGKETAFATPWEDLKRMLTDEYCTRAQIQEMEVEFWELKVKGTDIGTYNTRFQELALMCPNLVTPEYKKIERYIWGLPDRVQDVVAASKDKTMGELMILARELVMQAIRREAATKQTVNRPVETRKREGTDQGRNSNSYPNKRSGNEGQNSGSGYAGQLPYCNRCGKHHHGWCTIACQKCKKTGHMARDCREKLTATPASAANRVPIGNCYECGEPGHHKNNCPKKKTELGPARGRAYVIATDKGTHPGLYDHIGTFSQLPLSKY